VSVTVAGAARTLREGGLVVYPTETVYGLGADATDPEAVERVFEAKGRDRDKPLSVAVPDSEAAREYVRATPRTRRFMDEFLPGPVTVICEKRARLPDALTGGRERVGVRVPDHDLALSLLDEFAPVTATSANRSGGPNARRAADVPASIRERATVLDGGETPGGESTVVDVEKREIVRRGLGAAEIEAWLAEQ
jgi:L-threonylcarbamoyladenylate synthase